MQAVLRAPPAVRIEQSLQSSALGSNVPITAIVFICKSRETSYKSSCVWNEEAFCLLMATKPTAQLEDCLTRAYTLE